MSNNHYTIEMDITRLTDIELRQVLELLLKRLNLKLVAEVTPDYTAFELVERDK